MYKEISDETGTFEGSNGKILQNGQIIIIRGGKKYTLTGYEL